MPIKATDDFLENMLASFLIDIANAQNASNINSAELAVIYSDPALPLPACLKYFPIPVPVIKSFEFTVQFAFEGFNSYMDNILFEELKQAIEPIIQGLGQQDVTGNSSESITHEIFEEAKAELNRLVLNVTQKNEVIQQFCVFLKKLRADAIKKRHPAINAESQLELKNIRKSLEQALTDFNQPLADLKTAFKNIKMVYDLNKLNNLNGDVLCSLKVNVEMQNLQLGFDDSGLSVGDDEVTHKKPIKLI